MKLWEEAPLTDIFGIRIYSFGLFCAIGILCSIAVIFVLCKAFSTKKGTDAVLSCLCIICGIIFSRLFFCLFEVITYDFPFFAFFRISTGGWSLFGAIAGVFFGSWVTSKIMKEPSGKLLDIVSCAFPLTVAAERFAERCFDGFNISRELREGAFPDKTFLAVQDKYYPNVSYLATYLLCAAAAVFLFLTLVFFLTRQDREAGDLWILFMILFGTGAIFLESLRYDHFMVFSFVRFQQVFAAVMLIAGVILAGIRNRGAHKGFILAAFISLPIAIGICGGIEYALDRTTLNHYLLYAVMFAVLSIPVIFGVLLLRKRTKGKDTL